MKRYAILFAAIVAAMLLLFLLAGALDVPFLDDPERLRNGSAAVAAVIGVVLLSIDVVLPVGSSVVMVVNGAVFGVLLGTALSMTGSLIAFAAGFALGRRGLAVVARIVPDEERRRADGFLQQWGVVGIILSRPVPILAETLAFLAGTSPLRWRAALGAAALGYLPAAALYAIVGAMAATFATAAVVFIVVVVVALGAAVFMRSRQASVNRTAP